MMTGLIRKALSGFYYVASGVEEYECRARGLFRKEEVTPLVGDWVEFEPEGKEHGCVTKILPRKNEFARPPLANLDQLFLVAAVVAPTPNPLVLDKLLAVCEYKEIEPVLVITKTDLGDPFPLQETYERAGFPVLTVCSMDTDERGIAALRARLAGRVSGFCGNTGVGKSSLLNRLYPGLSLNTGAISQKLGRGKHTTRHVELFPVEGGGMVADTPGFGAMELSRYEIIHKEQLAYCFREFAPYLLKCRFPDCSHTAEAGCAVLEALRAGKIAPSRHESYRALYEQAKQIKDWERDTPHRKNRES